MRQPFTRRIVFALALLAIFTTTSTVTAQFGGGEGDAEAKVEPLQDLIAISVWVLTVNRSGEPDEDELVGKLIDRAQNLPPIIGTTDEVRDLVDRLKAAGLLSKSREVRLVTLDGQTGRAQTGADEPTVSGSNFTKAGQSNNIMYRSVGTIVEVTPRIDAEAGIQVKLLYNCSYIEKTSDVELVRPTEGKPLMADLIATQQVETFARLKSGTAVLAWSDTTSDTATDHVAGETRMILLAATVLPTLE